MEQNGFSSYLGCLPVHSLLIKKKRYVKSDTCFKLLNIGFCEKEGTVSEEQNQNDLLQNNQ